MMMSVLPARRRAAEARSMLLVDHMPGPVAAVQQSHMPGACQELGTITSPASARVSARLPVWLAAEQAETYSSAAQESRICI